MSSKMCFYFFINVCSIDIVPESDIQFHVLYPANSTADLFASLFGLKVFGSFSVCMDFRSWTRDENVNRGTLMQKPKCPTIWASTGEKLPLLPKTGPKGGGNENTADDPSAANRNVEIWKIKQLIKSLEVARSKGPSVVSSIIPPQDQISRLAKMLPDEFESACNIQFLANCLSVLEATTCVQQLKLQNKVPSKGADSLLWYNCNRRRKGKESQHWLWTLPNNHYIVVRVWQQIPFRGSYSTISGWQLVGVVVVNSSGDFLTHSKEIQENSCTNSLRISQRNMVEEINQPCILPFQVCKVM